MGKQVGIRKNVVLTPAALQRLEFIKTGTDLNTDAEAIREALRTFEKLMTAQLKGAQIQIEHKGGGVELLPHLFEEYAALDAIKSMDNMRQKRESARAALYSAD